MFFRVRLENVQIFLERDQFLGYKTLVAFGQQTECTLRCLRPLNDVALCLSQRPSSQW